MAISFSLREAGVVCCCLADVVVESLLIIGVSVASSSAHMNHVCAGHIGATVNVFPASFSILLMAISCEMVEKHKYRPFSKIYLCNQ